MCSDPPHQSERELNLEEVSLPGGTAGSRATTEGEAQQTCKCLPCGSRPETLVRRRNLQFLSGSVREHGTPKHTTRSSWVHIQNCRIFILVKWQTFPFMLSFQLFHLSFPSTSSFCAALPKYNSDFFQVFYLSEQRFSHNSKKYIKGTQRDRTDRNILCHHLFMEDRTTLLSGEGKPVTPRSLEDWFL